MMIIQPSHPLFDQVQLLAGMLAVVGYTLFLVVKLWRALLALARTR